MRLSHVLKTALKLPRIYAGGIVPLKVQHYITYRCNLRCSFCDAWKNKSKEMDTRQIKEAMDIFKRHGAISWSISGGEPFIRPDFPEIMAYARSKGFMTSIVTNGTFPDRISKVKDSTDLMLISIEGDESETDRFRGRGTYRKIIRTLEAVRKHGINANLNTVIKPGNRKQLEYIISLAREYGTFCGFQPLFDYMRGGREVEEVVRSKAKLMGLLGNIDFLIREKKKGSPILNSLSHLKYMKNYGSENFKKLRCFAGRNTVLLEPDGTLKMCYWDPSPVPPGNLEESLKRVSKPSPGCYCWPKCHGENNLMFSLSLEAIMNATKKI